MRHATCDMRVHAGMRTHRNPQRNAKHLSDPFTTRARDVLVGSARRLWLALLRCVSRQRAEAVAGSVPARRGYTDDNDTIVIILELYLNKYLEK
jgi:hypothetical protein